jgi:hypothetical protein
MEVPKMKWIIPVCAAVMTACTYAPVVEDPNERGIMAPDAADVAETQRLEQTESDCASQGKHAEASRVEGHTVYSCVD